MVNNQILSKAIKNEKGNDSSSGPTFTHKGFHRN